MYVVLECTLTQRSLRVRPYVCICIAFTRVCVCVSPYTSRICIYTCVSEFVSVAYTEVYVPMSTCQGSMCDRRMS